MALCNGKVFLGVCLLSIIFRLINFTSDVPLPEMRKPSCQHPGARLSLALSLSRHNAGVLTKRHIHM